MTSVRDRSAYRLGGGEGSFGFLLLLYPSS